MSLIEFHIWPRSDPLGEANKVAVLTDEDVHTGQGGPAIWFNPMLHGLGGEAGFTLSRKSALALAPNVAEDNIVRVKNPLISTGYLKFGWVMSSFEHALVSAREEAGELVTVKGPGLLRMLAWANLDLESTVSDQPFRGSNDHDDVWWWVDEPWGAILTRGIEEGRHSPYPDPAAAGSPLEFLNIDFDRTEDSDGNLWPNIDTEFQVPIGTDVMSLADALRESGNLYLIPDASDVNDLQLHAYQTYGRDLTGSFGAATVRFERAVNIATNLTRLSESKLALTHLLMRDSDGEYSHHVWSGYSAGAPETWGFWDADQTNHTALLNQIGQNVINASRTAIEAVGLEIPAGQDPANGLYLWGPDGTTGHFDVGDTVTLHTGTAAEEFNEADQLVTAVKVSVREAAASDTTLRAERSLKIEPQLNYYSPRYGSSNIGTGPTQVPGCRCLRLCVPGTAGTDATLGTVLFTRTWDYEDGNLNSTLGDYPWGTTWQDAGTGYAGNHGALSTAYGRSGSSSAEGGAGPHFPCTPGGLVQIVGTVARNWFSETFAVREYVVRWYTAGGSHISSVVLYPPACSSYVAAAFDLQAVAPATAEGFGVVLKNNTSQDDVTVTSYDTDGTPATAGTPNDGNVDLVGTSSRAKRCDDTEHYHTDRDPTTDDNWDGGGWRHNTLWVNETTGAAFLLIDADAGTWLQISAGAAALIPPSAEDVEYDPTTSGLTADDVQEAIDELAARGGVTSHGDLTDRDPLDAHDQYAERGAGLGLTVDVISDAGSALTLDLAYTHHKITLTEACDITLPTFDAGGLLREFSLELVGDFDVTLASEDGAVTFVGLDDLSADGSAMRRVVLDTVNGIDWTAKYKDEPASDPSADTHVWMPLTTVVGGVPELVWDADDSLIPTLVPLE